MNETIQYEEKAHKEEIYTLWQETFHDLPAFADYYFDWIYPNNRILTAMRGDRLCSMLHLNPYTWVWDNGRKKERLHLHYIVGVATEPNVRRQGMMRKCMERALRDMEAAGEPFTYLMPEKREYYEPFQFVMLTEERKVPADQSGAFLSDRSKYECFPIRDAGYRERLAAEIQCEGGGIIEWNNGESYCAYVPNFGGSGIVIEQLFETEPSAVWQKVILPKLEQQGHTEITYRKSQAMMLRILSLERFVEILPYEGEKKQLLVRLSDPICVGNNGWFLLVLSPEGCQLVKQPGESRTEETTGKSREEVAVNWDIGQLADYLLEETRLAKRIYLMEVV